MYKEAMRHLFLETHSCNDGHSHTVDVMGASPARRHLVCQQRGWAPLAASDASALLSKLGCSDEKTKRVTYREHSMKRIF
jgi:hypothetical protein